MMVSLGFRIALLFLLFILILRLFLMGWRKVALKRTNRKFKFLLTEFSLKGDIGWQDVKYSLLVIIDSLITLIILLWVFDKIF
jgi:hypothetical protein